MSQEENNQSEIAQIKQQIEAEQESARRALHSSAYGAAQHRFITARMERMGILHSRLKDLVGEAEAAKMLAESMGKEGNNDGK